MNTTDLPDIATLDADGLRREIATRLGYTRGEELSPFVVYGDVSRGARFKLYRWARPDGSFGEASSLHEFGDNTLFPDWPRDTGAALALCLEIARRHNNWEVNIVQHAERNFWASFMENPHGLQMVPIHTVSDKTASLTLSWLALAALRAGA